VAAQNSALLEATHTPIPLPTLTTTPLVFSPTLTPAATKLPPTLPSAQGADADCAKATWVGDTPPDGTILGPGEQFTKVWQIQNNSTCTWDTSYQILFWSGDIMGGAYVYNFPQSAVPGQTIDVPLVLIAPSVDGAYESQWMFKTPGGTTFGVGQYNVPFTASIVVDSTIKKSEYIVTSVDYKITRTPPSGCPANVTYTAYATITTNGPMSIKYRWIQSDGNDGVTGKLEFETAGVQTVSTTWKLHLGSSPNDHRWFALVIVDPAPQEFYPGIGFEYTCKSP